MQVNWNTAYEIESQVADIIMRQEINGWKFDRGKAIRSEEFLTSEMERIYEEVRPSMRKLLKVHYKTPISKLFLKTTGEPTSGLVTWYPEAGERGKVGGPFSRIDWVEPNLGSDKQVKELLSGMGWEPTEWNYKKSPSGRKIYDSDKNPIKSSPKLTEDSYDSIVGGIGPSIAEYLKAKHRRSTIQGWLKVVDDNDFIHAIANPLGTPTGRFTHRVVVNVPKPKDYVYFGKTIRSLFTCREGYRLVGHDFSGLEARVMAHYLNDPDLTAKLIFGNSKDGTDFHTFFWKPLEDFIDSRDNAKNVEYA